MNSIITTLPTDYQTYIQLSRYSRFIPEKKRRESWDEIVTRYCDFFKNIHPDVYPYDTIKNAIKNLEVMPSMRGLMTAGKALDKDNAAIYNCSYIAVDDHRAFDEAMYLLMCGVGVGFSVERQLVNKLPEVAEEFHNTDTIIKVKDSKIGWAASFRELISLLYSGQIPNIDLSSLRPAGSPLKTFGGRSSGPGPLSDLFDHCIRIFKSASGRKLTSLECHDIMCHVASAVVVGGTRRSACISLSNLSDDRMRNAKMGQWWLDHPERALSNNSVAYTEKPDIGTFMREWLSLYDSKSGERGFFNRKGAIDKMKKLGRRDAVKFENSTGATNPCGEILLRSSGLCNLSEVVIREDDTLEILKNKIEIATIIGTFQASLTNFRYLRAAWKKNAEEERLLGVSLTGIMDHYLLSKPSSDAKRWLNDMRDHATSVNKKWSEIIGIAPAVAITTGKPSGTASQLVDSSSGIHPRFSHYYIRTVRSDKLDPIGIFLKEQGVACEEDVTNPNKTWIFSFPMKSPEHARVASEMTAIDQLEHYLMFYEAWADHNISITVYVRDHEWMTVGAWVYEHFDRIGGISFLPYSDNVYKQAPYQEITKEEYDQCLANHPKIDWSIYNIDEHEDKTIGVQTLSCTSGVCEIV